MRPEPVVLDASAYVRASQGNVQAVQYLRRHAYKTLRFHAPPHFFLEVANAFRNTTLNRRTKAEGAHLALNGLLKMTFEVDNDPKLVVESLDFALARGITAYDASYAVLSLRHQASLVTADSGLAQTAQAAGIAAALIVDEAAR